MDPGHLLQVVAVAMTLSLLIFATTILSAQGGRRRDQSFFLAAFLVLCIVGKADALTFLLGGYNAAPQLSGFAFLSIMLLGPAIYFYARSATAARPSWLSWRDLWALSGPLLMAVIISDFYFWSPEKKLLMFTQQFTPEISAWLERTCKLVFISFFVFSVGCLAAAFRLLLRHTERMRDLFSNIEDRALGWLRWILLILAAGWGWQTANSLWGIQGGKPAWVDTATAFFELAWIGGIALCAVLQRPVNPGPADAADAVKYARSALGDERMDRIAAKLEKAMTRDRRFEDAGLSLRALSGHLGVSEYYISQTLNEKLGVNFFDFVNRHRIDAARRRLETTPDSIQAIAHEVGFNSRSTFNAAFRKHAGGTPSQYRLAFRAGADGIADASSS